MTNVLATNDLTLLGTQNFSISPNLKVAFLKDVKSTGTDGGSSAAGFQDRTLNTLEDPDSLLTLDAGNVLFSFNSLGTYLIYAKAPAYRTVQSKLFFTDSSNNIQIIGNSGRSDNNTTGWCQGDSFVTGFITITNTSTQYKLRHYTGRVQSNNGLGIASFSGEDEIYSLLRVIKLG